MIRFIMILLIAVVLTNCTKLDFDGFDPTTTTLRWIMKNDTK
tara:strand:- start:255 stop:380 length:126 start_codon:yes stop_codon:yes gene_type:complete